MTSKTLYWYDFETFGKNAKRDRASQFAGVRTDEDLNIIGEPLLIYCRPSPDFLPAPMACYITGITPQKALAEGVSEDEFIRRILAELSEPGTCGVGYNSVRFDDELARQLLYRNFHDPYEREYKNGNSRWDLIDVVRLCAAVRPEGINWPLREDGQRSFKLDQLTVANGIEHGAAHDALADVIATIEMAKLLRRAQPRLYDFAYQQRSKAAVRAQFDLRTNQPVLHVSMAYPAAQGCLSVVMPLCVHPTNSNALIVCDLRTDPAVWLDLSAQEIAARLYKKRADREEGEEAIPLQSLATNKCPVIAPLNVLNDKQAREYGLQAELWQRHFEKIKSDPRASVLASQAFAGDSDISESDPDFMIYSGFFGEADKKLMSTIRRTPAADLGRLDMPFRDARLQEMLFRYRARNWPDTLSEAEAKRWREFCLTRTETADVLADFEAGLAEVEALGGSEAQTLVAELRDYQSSLSQQAIPTALPSK